MNVDYKKIPLLSILTTLAISVSLLEQFVPLNHILVGAKLGLSNIIIIFAINRLTKNEAILILLAKIFVVTLISGRISSFLFSLIGGLLSFGISCYLMRFYPKNLSFIGICIAGCSMHHIGQVVVGCLLFTNFVVFSYLPYLLIISIPLGIITGSFVELLIKKLDKITNCNLTMTNCNRCNKS